MIGIFTPRAVCGVILSAMAVGLAMAREITVDEARSVAEAFMSDKLRPGSRAEIRSPQLVEAGMSAADEDDALYYIFNYDSAGSFVVVSADDIMRPVLGYSGNGVYDPDRVPEALKWWLEQYRLYGGTGESRNIVSQSGESQRPAVDPLVRTTWDQDNPYNLSCPAVAPGISGHAYTGCVATAMAQIVKYHNWPADGGRGSNSYTSGGKYDVSFDFAKARFDWDNMPDRLVTGRPGVASPEVQVRAVDELMYACGVAIDMQYDRGEGSSSYNALVPEGLREYLCYDPMVRHVYRASYTDADWEELIYSELAAGRPVQYGGYTPSGGGHSFVCDGYDGNGLFHINWGWGGVSDGFFALSVLDPDEQGAGSSDGGYNSSQDAVIGIRPPVEGSKTFCSLYCDGAVSYDNDRTFRLSGWITNESYNRHVYSLGVIVRNRDGEDVKIVPGEGNGLDLTGYMRGTGGKYEGGQYTNGCRITVPSGSFADLPEGSYRIYPAYRTGDMDWTVLPTGEEPHYISYDVHGTGGIDEVGTDRFEIRTDGTMLTITGALEGDLITIYDIAGRTVYTSVYHAPAMSIGLPSRGLYILTCGSRKHVIASKTQ